MCQDAYSISAISIFFRQFSGIMSCALSDFPIAVCRGSAEPANPIDRKLIPTAKIDPKHPEGLGVHAVAAHRNGVCLRFGFNVQNDYPRGDDAAVQHGSGLHTGPQEDLAFASRFEDQFPDGRIQ
jgi:hypothetical protein